MNNLSKLTIYKSMIQYILDTTNCTLKNIADLSDSSLTIIRTIYYNDHLPSTFKSEMKLLKLYKMLVETDTCLKSRH